MPVSVLFVCLGNICRSPLADGIIRRLAKEAAFDVRVESAGTGDWHIGHPPDRRAQAEAKGRGLDISDLRARQVTPADFDAFDYIVAMDSQNLADLVAMRPRGSKAEVSRLLDHVDAGAVDVPDPYYGGDEGFAETYALVEAGARGLLQKVMARAAASPANG